MVTDHAVPGRVGVELADQRLDVAGLVGVDGGRPLPLRLRLGARRLGLGHHGHRRQQHDADEQHAQQRRVARGAPRERDALDRREVREHREDPQRRLEQVQERAGDQADHALRALHDAHGAAHADRLGARLRVAHHHRADQAGHRDDRAAHLGHVRVEHDDPQQHHQVGVPIDDRVEEGAEGRDLARSARQRAVEEVAEPGQDQEDAAGADARADERRRRQKAHAEPDQRQVVRPEMQMAIERQPDRIDPAADGLTVAAEHRQMGCTSACSSASRTRPSASGSSTFRPRPSCT